MKIKNLLIFLLIFFACENPIDTNSSEELESNDVCSIHTTESICGDNNSCQWINSECVTITSTLCTLNYGGIIDECGFCSSGSTGIEYNKDKNLCGICFADDPSDPSMLVFYDHDDNNSTPELFCGCQGYNSSELNDGCCGIIGSSNFFRDDNNHECNPNDSESNNCINIVQRDVCGFCAGNGFDQNGLFPDGSCDCDGNTLDCFGECPKIFSNDDSPCLEI